MKKIVYLNCSSRGKSQILLLLRDLGWSEDERIRADDEGDDDDDDNDGFRICLTELCLGTGQPSSSG